MNLRKLIYGLTTLSSLAIILLGMSIYSVLESDAQIRNQVKNLESQQKISLDNMAAIIRENSDLPDDSDETIKKFLPSVLDGNVDGRFFKIIQNQYPTITLQVYMKLSQMIEPERQKYFEREKKILSLKKESDVLFNHFSSRMILNIVGRYNIELENREPIIDDNVGNGFSLELLDEVRH